VPLAGAAIGAGSSILGGILGSSAASKAAQQQAAGQQNAIDTTNAAKSESLSREAGLYSDEKAALNPYQTAGTGALAGLAAGTAPGGQFVGSPTSSQVMAQSPGYQFNLDEGTKALQRAEAASGTVGSGGAVKAGVQYAQDYATNSYQNAYNQYMGTRQSNYNNLLQLAGLGQTANGQFLGAAQNYGAATTGVDENTANKVGGYQAGIGDSQASGTIGAANAWTGALSGLAHATSGIGAKSTGYGGGATAPASAPASSSGYGGGVGYNWDPVTGTNLPV